MVEIIKPVITGFTSCIFSFVFASFKFRILKQCLMPDLKDEADSIRWMHFALKSIHAVPVGLCI